VQKSRKRGGFYLEDFHIEICQGLLINWDERRGGGDVSLEKPLLKRKVKNEPLKKNEKQQESMVGESLS